MHWIIEVTQFQIPSKFTKENGTITVRPRWEKLNMQVRYESFDLENGKVAHFRKAGMMHLDVVDNGAGMTAEQLSDLFGEGVQFNVNVLQAGQGSGLGLYIAKGLTVQHGGTLEAHSEGLEKGTTFTMSLPLHRVPAESPGLSSEAESAISSCEKAPIKFESLNVLVVDDAPMNRKLLVRLLTREGHQCSEAVDGLMAIAMVRQAIDTNRPYDTILMDYEMPNMNVRMRSLSFSLALLRRDSLRKCISAFVNRDLRRLKPFVPWAVIHLS